MLHWTDSGIVGLTLEYLQPGPVHVFEGPEVEQELDEVDLYADPDYAGDKE